MSDTLIKFTGNVECSSIGGNPVAASIARMMMSQDTALNVEHAQDVNSQAMSAVAGLNLGGFGR